MANKHTAIAFVIVLEDDHKFPGSITQLRGDSGGKTRLGIAERFHPQLSLAGFFEGDPIDGTNPLRWKPTTISVAMGGTVAEDTYTTEYADPLRIEELEDQELANRLLALAVNAGQHQGVVTLQRALGISADGVMGPATIAAANKATQASSLFAIEEKGFYQHVAANNPSLAEYAKGMLNRAAA